MNMNWQNQNENRAYSARVVGTSLQVYDALTGAPWTSISINHNGGLASFHVSGCTLSVSFKSGAVEVYDLDARRKLR